MRDLGEKCVCDTMELENARQKVGERSGRSGRKEIQRCDRRKKGGRSFASFQKGLRARFDRVLELEAKEMKDERGVLMKRKGKSKPREEDQGAKEATKEIGTPIGSKTSKR